MSVLSDIGNFLKEHTPIVSTIIRINTDWTGGDSSEYESCKVDPAACSDSTVINNELIRRCKSCIDVLKLQHIAALPSPSLVKAFLQGVGSGVLLAVGIKAIAKVAGKVLTGLGLVFVLDDLIDIGVWIYRKGKIEDAAKKAKADYCKCG